MNNEGKSYDNFQESSANEPWLILTVVDEILQRRRGKKIKPKGL